MSGERSTARTTLARAGEGLPTGRSVGLAIGALFWAWLVVRWVTIWAGYSEPFFPVAFFEGLATGFENDALVMQQNTGALAPVLDFVAGFWFLFSDVASFVAFAVEYLPTLAEGAWLTVVLTVAGIAFGLVIAVPLSVARVYGGVVTRSLALVYIELIRGTPLLAQLFVIYYGLNMSQYFRGVSSGLLPTTAVWVAIVGFTINSAAYQAEYIRSALESVESGQLTAARAIGLSRIDGIRHVVLPQGLRYAIPGWTNELVYLIKYSSLAAFITVVELFESGRDIAGQTFQYLNIYALLALFYLALVLSATLFMGWVEDRVAIPGLGVRDGRE
ncbi:amino acid ABC transporter permease [Halomarina rubra]|uniref:Amino acid ABC transporter permease n=1 Tax=Halomarina rubra TaxID=2071873 RepID=A0ABD6AVS7_9EURY|nr:amino acid ABC transporter permease [Halomarina rubra]